MESREVPILPVDEEIDRIIDEWFEKNYVMKSKKMVYPDPEVWLKWDDVIDAIGFWGGEPRREYFDDAIKRIQRQQRLRLEKEKE